MDLLTFFLNLLVCILTVTIAMGYLRSTTRSVIMELCGTRTAADFWLKSADILAYSGALMLVLIFSNPHTESLADAIRDAFARHRLDEASAHWLCIRLLGVTAELVARLLPEAVLVKQFDEITSASPATLLAIFDPEQFLRDETVDPLPHSWDVTSDSIAARVAARLDTAELVLLKSHLPSGHATLQEAAHAGFVDRYFPIAAAELARIRCVNLRAENVAEVALRAPPRPPW